MHRLLLISVFVAVLPARAECLALWLALPATPVLPPPAASGYASVNNIRIWYAEYGQGEPVILLHGGLANASYWGSQIPVLAQFYRVIVMDSRGHGRSTADSRP